jgi:hypothetical protein
MNRINRYFKLIFDNPLKVPNCENFHCTDFFYTIKPLWVGDIRAKKIKILIFRGSFWSFFFENFVLEHTECGLKKVLMFTFELTCMLQECFLEMFTLSGFLGFFKIFGFLACIGNFLVHA